MRNRTRSALMGALAAAAIAAAPVSAQIAAHPSDIMFPELDFTPPVGTTFRSELPNGIPIYIAPSHEFPLVTVALTFRGGQYLEPADQTGLAGALGSQMRRGGTTSVSAEEMDERFDFLAANVSTFVGPETSGASINCLKSNFEEAFVLFLDMIQNPGFEAERLRVYKGQVIEGLKQRNDAPMSVAMLNMAELAYGQDHYNGRQPTQATVESITPDALRALHARIFHPGNLIVSVTGDVEPAEIMSFLSRAFDGWALGETAGDPPAPTAEMTPGLYHAAVAQQDLPQGTTILVSRGLKRDDPDFIPMTVMNQILGGGGFTSRIMNRVRSDEGLAYGASSFLQTRVYHPGLFGAFFQSKNRTVAYATKIILEEINRIREQPVTEEELATAKNAFIEQFPQRFSSKAAMLSVFVDDEITGRDPGYWQNYRDNVRAVDSGAVQSVAQRHLHPDQMMILVVGDWDEIYGGDLEGRATMNDFFNGNVNHLPMRDPLTLEPMDD